MNLTGACHWPYPLALSHKSPFSIIAGARQPDPPYVDLAHSLRFPNTTDADKAVLLLARKWILPFARDPGAGGLGVSSKVDGLFERTTMDLVRCYDSQLKKLFAWCVVGAGCVLQG